MGPEPAVKMGVEATMDLLRLREESLLPGDFVETDELRLGFFWGGAACVLDLPFATKESKERVA